MLQTGSASASSRKDPAVYRDLQLLTEIMQTPHATQRALAKRIGVALGLANLMLRRLAEKGHIKIVNVRPRRIRYLITPKGILEKTRLTYEFIEYSLHYYRSVRRFLWDHLSPLIADGHRRILLFGTGELAEIAYLTLQDVGLECVGIVEEDIQRRTFLGQPVRGVEDLAALIFDRIVIVSAAPRRPIRDRLIAAGVEPQRLITVPDHRMPLTDAGSSPVPNETAHESQESAVAIEDQPLGQPAAPVP